MLSVLATLRLVTDWAGRLAALQPEQRARSVASMRKKIVTALFGVAVVSGVLLFWAYGNVRDLMPKQDATGRLKSGGYGLLLLNPEQLSVSSFGSPTMGKEALVDGNADTYWHVANPKVSREDWVQMELAEPLEIAGLRVLARRDTNQLWSGANAVWQGSRDGKTWEDLSLLDTTNKITGEGRWVAFLLPPSAPFRFYRLTVVDPRFYSIAELEIYTKESGRSR